MQTGLVHHREAILERDPVIEVTGKALESGQLLTSTRDFTPARSVTIRTSVEELIEHRAFPLCQNLCWRKTLSVIVVKIFLDILFLIQYQKSHSRECGKLINMDGKAVNSSI